MILRRKNLLFGILVFVLMDIANSPNALAANLRWFGIDKGPLQSMYRGGGMIAQKDAISAIDQNAGNIRFYGTKIEYSSVTNDATPPRPLGNYSANMFLSSDGTIYIGGRRSDDNHSYIFESNDDGLNYTTDTPLVDTNQGGYIWNFTEDKYGNIWAGEYTSTSQGTTGAYLWRKKGGVWNNVASWPINGSHNNHIHWTYYDPYRDSLYVAIGDADEGILKLHNTSDILNSDTVSESDFSFILTDDGFGHGMEVTAITSDANYVYAGTDYHNSIVGRSRAIIRFTDDNVSQNLEFVNPLPSVSGKDCAIYRWAHVDDNGVVIFSTVGSSEFTCGANERINKIYASDDQGDTWQTVKDWGSSSSGTPGMYFSGLPSYYSTNWSGLYAGGSGWGDPYNGRASMGRVLSDDKKTFYINQTSGTDWTNLGLSSLNPIDSFEFLESMDLEAGDLVNILGATTYNSPLRAGWSGDGTGDIKIKGSASANLSGGQTAPDNPLISENFDGAIGSWKFYRTAGDGTITQDTDIKHSGTASAKIVYPGTSTTTMDLTNPGEQNVSDGDTLYMQYYIYYATDCLNVSNYEVFSRIIDDGTPNYEIRTKRDNKTTYNPTLTNEIVTALPARATYTDDIPSNHSITKDTWHKVDYEVKLDDVYGYFKLYIDDELWIYLTGIKTISDTKKINAFRFYEYLSGNSVTFYVDDFKFSDAPIDDVGAINTNDYDYLNFSDLNLSGAIGSVFSSGSTNVTLQNSIINGTTGDATINNANTDISYYFNTIFNSGGYGINTSANATAKNNVVYNSTSGDINIGASATVTGTNNYFKSSAKSGSGTYTDAGSTTTWSGDNPGFQNAGSDFKLAPSSSLINMGTTISGITDDILGNTRSSIPDIGAYEFLLPSTPSSLSQYKSNGATSISAGAWVDQNNPIMKFTMSSSNETDQLTPQVEVQPYGKSFTGTPNYTGSAVNYSGNAVNGTVSLTSLSNNTRYHWQARVNNAKGNGLFSIYSSSPAFGIDTTAPSVPGEPNALTEDNNNTPEWHWTASSDSGSGLASLPYTIQWCDNDTFTGYSSQTAQTSNNSYTFTTSLADGTWYFRVKATDAVGNVSNYSNAGSLTINTSSSSGGDSSSNDGRGGRYAVSSYIISTQIVSADEIALKDADQNPEINGYTLKIKVIDKNRNPVVDATVELHSDIQTATSDSNGIATFYNVASGIHKIYVSYGRYHGEREINVGGDISEINIDLEIKPYNYYVSWYAIVLYIIGGLIIIIFIYKTLNRSHCHSAVS